MVRRLGGRQLQPELLAQVGVGEGVQRPAILQQQAQGGVAGLGEVDSWPHPAVPQRDQAAGEHAGHGRRQDLLEAPMSYSSRDFRAATNLLRSVPLSKSASAVFGQAWFTGMASAQIQREQTLTLLRHRLLCT